VPAYLRVWRAIWGTSPTPSADGSHPPTDGFREIIETIVFVVVLVLMLRCFVAEAFVIPTGSMAETLYGYQKNVTCPQCGWLFPVNCAEEVEPRDPGQAPRITNSCQCPNCLLNIRLAGPNDPPAPAGTTNVVADPGYSTGDRVLVAKFLYDLLGRRPDRLDVVVFKFPGDDQRNGPWPSSGPQSKGVPMNYIKRLIGLPGETIYIYRGDLYHSKPDLHKWEAKDFADCQTEAEKEARRQVLWRKKGTDYTHETAISPSDKEYDEILQKMRDGEIVLIRKGADKILAERRLVYHNDYLAADLLAARAEPRWKPEGEGIWTAQGTEFHAVGVADRTGWLRYRHLKRSEKGGNPVTDPTEITDTLGYNSYPGGPFDGRNWVKDLVLECEVDVTKADGEFSMELSAGVDRFRAVWNLSDGVCTLYRSQPHGTALGEVVGFEKPEKLDSKATKLKGVGKHLVRFANVDQQLVVWVDGSLPFGAHGVQYAPPKNSDKVRANDIEQPASLGVQGATLTVRHLSLWRDVYYLLNSGGEGTINSFYVQPGHYFCMGDNSGASSDSRVWGLVPDRLLLGKAQLVYFPFYFPWSPLKTPVNRVGIIN
jgi:signal peptidase I